MFGERRSGLERRRTSVLKHVHLQMSLNGPGLMAVQRTVFVIDACPRKCCRRRLSIPLPANA
jgi:hypothetical protein